ncbi:MAG: CBS domain-containing protein [Terriglobales bacterium]
MSILRLLDRESITVPPSTTVADAIQIMLDRRVGSVVIVEAKQVLGIFTERDVLRKLALSGRDPKTIAVSELMTAPAITVDPNITPAEALASMLEHHFRHLPVVDSRARLRGVLSIRNLLQEMMEKYRHQLHSLEQHVISEEPGATKARG